jgi:hypothetical protein
LRGIVSIPLEPCEYNIIYDDGERLHKIKVISCSFKTKYGVFSASIRTSGGNQPNSKIKKFEQKYCDWVFVVTSEFDFYQIPSCEINSSRQISLKKYSIFQVNLIPS